MLANTPALRCFSATGTAAPRRHWFQAWQQQYPGSLSLSSQQQIAFAKLVPLLLCGEQSAQQIFKHLSTVGDQQKYVSALHRIEQEEQVHEQALQGVLLLTGKPADEHKRRRRSQRFYASLGQANSAAEHFASIEQLDSGVCKIMHAVSHSALGRQHPLSQLFERIKQDEASHVGLSRQYSSELGIGPLKRQAIGRDVSARLAGFLSTDVDSFEAIGVDPDALLKRIAGDRP